MIYEPAVVMAPALGRLPYSVSRKRGAYLVKLEKTELPAQWPM